MNKVFGILLVVFSLVLSPSNAEWTKVLVSKEGNTFYVDFDRVKKHDGHVYLWNLVDLLKPDLGVFSFEVYRQIDCNGLFLRFKNLSYIRFKQPMGRDTGETNNPPYPEWYYPPHDSPMVVFLNKVCGRVSDS